MSLRHKHRRAAREDPSKPLTVSEIARLNAQRALPLGHPSSTKDYPILAPLDMSLHAIDVVGSSGVLPYLKRKLRGHPGKRSDLSLLALLVVMVLAAMLRSSYRRTDLCAVLCGLEAEVAYKLELCSRAARKLLSYNVINKQCLRLERALLEGWVDKDGTVCDQDWFAHCLLKANIPEGMAEQITAIAIDSTFLLAWAVPGAYSPDKESTGKPCSADVDARWGHRSATSKRKAGMRLGFDDHITVGVRPSDWKGRTDSANLGEPVPIMPLHMKLVPADPNVAPIALDCIEWTKKVAPNIEEVAADRIYTMKNENFNRRLRKEGLRVVMDQTAIDVERVRNLELGRNKHELIEHCGTFLPVWLDEDLHRPDPALTATKLRDWYDRRAKFRYSPTRIFEVGSIQMQCPQCAGRIRSNLKTRNRKAKPNNNAPFIVRTDDAVYCCVGRVTIPVKELDHYQSIPYGTTAWKQSYNRRNQIENLNGMLRDKGGLADRWCRSLEIGARLVGSVMMLVAHGMRETRPEWANNHYRLDEELLDDEHENGASVSGPPLGPEDSQPVDRSRDGPA